VVGAARDVTVPGETGLLAEGTGEWADALRGLRDDPGLRERMGRAGRRRVEERYSVRAVEGRLARILREAAGRPDSANGEGG